MKTINTPGYYSCLDSYLGVGELLRAAQERGRSDLLSTLGALADPKLDIEKNNLRRHLAIPGELERALLEQYAPVGVCYQDVGEALSVLYAKWGRTKFQPKDCLWLLCREGMKTHPTTGAIPKHGKAWFRAMLHGMPEVMCDGSDNGISASEYWVGAGDATPPRTQDQIILLTMFWDRVSRLWCEDFQSYIQKLHRWSQVGQLAQEQAELKLIKMGQLWFVSGQWSTWRNSSKNRIESLLALAGKDATYPEETLLMLASVRRHKLMDMAGQRTLSTGSTPKL